MSYLRKNFIYILFTLVLILILLSFLFYQLGPTNKKVIPSQTSPPIQEKPLPGISYNAVSKIDQKQLQRDLKVSQLIKKLPYKGEHFYLDYYFSNFIFTLTLYKSNIKLGEDEFNLYLKDNGIEDKAWLKNLVIKVT